MFADEQIFKTFVERTHAGLVKAIFAIGTRGLGVLDVVQQATLLTVDCVVVAVLVVTSIAAVFWYNVVVDASPFSWSART